MQNKKRIPAMPVLSYWVKRAWDWEYDYHPIEPNGKVHGYTACLPDVVDKVNKKRYEDHIEKSKNPPFAFPVFT